MHRADAENPHGGNLHGEEIAAAIHLHAAALAHAQGRVELLGERIARDLAALHKALIARLRVGDEHGGASRGAFLVEGLEEF